MSYKYSGDPTYNGPNPATYRLHAYHFLMCAKYAISGHEAATGRAPSMMLNAPLVHLICHAVEMFLKLALYKTGTDERALKDSSVRHNLIELRKRCEGAGVTFSADVLGMIDSLSPIHADHRLRYTAFQDAPIWLPFNPSEMIEIASKLVTAAHTSQSA
jgi:hypothetical protein